jgi:hypothetical protein
MNDGNEVEASASKKCMEVFAAQELSFPVHPP